MQITNLKPPHTQTLTDNTIGNVLLRANMRHRSVCFSFLVDGGMNGDFATALDKQSRQSKRVNQSSPGEPGAQENSFSVMTNNREPIIKDKRITRSKFYARLPISDDNVADAKAYNRERLRINQKRYRMRQRKMLSDLEETNWQLRAEIKRLTHQLSSIGNGDSATTSAWTVAVEYFRVFRKNSPSAEFNALQSNMAPDLDAGSVRGFKALVNKWKIFTESFQNAQLHLDNLEQVSKTLLVATTTTVVTISWSSLTNMFPHLRNETDETWSPLAKRLLGNRPVMRGTVCFHWDNAKNYVVALHTKIDMVLPMLQLLGDLEDVARVFDGAGITPDGDIVVKEATVNI